MLTGNRVDHLPADVRVAPPSPGPRRCAVLGSPVGHSLSPALHRAAYAALGLTGWRYDALEVAEDALPRFVAGLGRAAGEPPWRGLSLTMPLKRAVLPLLDGAESTVGLVGAANTVVIGEDGRRVGANTDVPGMVAALGSAGVRAGGPHALGRVLVLGGGATAAAALAALGRLGAGAGGRPPVELAVRDAARAARTLAVAERCDVAVRVVPLTAGTPAGARPGPVDLLIATLPGSSGDGVAGVVAGRLVPEAVVLDAVYEGWPTGLARAAAAAGARVRSGAELLVHQAVEQVRWFTGREVSPAVLRDALPPSLRDTTGAADA